MRTKHAKSSCCQGKIISFGKRRRQCVVCRKTWRIRKKKCGRKQKRSDPIFATKYLRHETPSLYAMGKDNKKEGYLKAHLRRSLDKLLLTTPWPKIPTQKPLIVIADAMMRSINHEMYSIYVILLRSINSSEALVTPPFIQKGRESWLGWQEAFGQLPESIMASIRALVADKHQGLRSVAKQNNWIFQGCHFHALAGLQGRWSRSRWSHHKEMGERIYKIATNILTNPNNELVKNRYIPDLIGIRKITTSSRAKTILSGFIRDYQCYRAYLYHQELHLPRTSNAVESLNSGFQDLCFRARGFRTIPSLTKWIHAFLKQRQKVKCNSYLPTKFPA